MLNRIKALMGGRLAATDGDIGQVDAVFFDDRKWAVRYFVVNTGGGLTGRKVLISPDAVDRDHSSEAAVAVMLTCDEVARSPGADSDMPQERRFEEAAARYNEGIENAKDLKSAEREAARSHLRSSDEVLGYAVQGTNGLIGHVDDLLVDDATWRITGLLVDAGERQPGCKIPVAPKSVRAIDWLTREVRVDHL